MAKQGSVWITASPGLLAYTILVLIAALALNGPDAARPVVDETLVDCAIAKTIRTDHVHAIHAAEPLPVTRDALWRIVLAFTGAGDVPAVPALAILFACGAMLVLLAASVATVCGAGKSGAGIASLLAATSAGLSLHTVTALPVALGSLCAAFALLRHVRSCAGGVPLSLASAVWIGLAMWTRIEFLVVWLAMWLHAIVSCIAQRRSVAWAICQGLSGLLLIALFMAPLLAMNAKAIGIPWPRCPDAPLSLDVWAVTSAAYASSSLFQAMKISIPSAYVKFADVLLSGPGSVVVLPGLLLVIGLALRRDDGSRAVRPCLVVCVVALALYGAIIPFVGWSSTAFVFSALVPLAAGAVGTALEWLSTKLPEKRVLRAGLVGVVSLLLLSSALIGQTRGVAAMMDLGASRAAALGTLEESGAQVVASDRAGWLLQAGVVAVDLRGETTPEVLASLDVYGVWKPTQLATSLHRRGVNALAIWDERHDVLAEQIGGQALGSGAGRPRLFRLVPRDGS